LVDIDKVIDSNHYYWVNQLRWLFFNLPGFMVHARTQHTVFERNNV